VQSFKPEPSQFYRRLASLALLFAVLQPVAWWKAPGAPPGVIISVSALVLAVFVGLPMFLVWRRGFDTIQVGKKGVVVSRKKGAFRLDWLAIANVQVRRGQIVFETGSTNERFIVFLKGHEHHQQDLFDAMKKRAERAPDVAPKRDVGAG
jgi:hypothetical protein